MFSENIRCACGSDLMVLRPGCNERSGWVGCLNSDCEYSIQNKKVLHFKAKTHKGDPGNCGRSIVKVLCFSHVPGKIFGDIYPIISQII